MKQYMDVMGKTVKDRITGFAGIVECVSFDLYGCVQVAVKPNMLTKDGSTPEGKWFDHKRLEVINHNRVLEMPNFDLASSEAKVIPKPLGRENGPAEKPRSKG